MLSTGRSEPAKVNRLFLKSDVGAFCLIWMLHTRKKKKPQLPNIEVIKTAWKFLRAAQNLFLRLQLCTRNKIL